MRKAQKTKKITEPENRADMRAVKELQLVEKNPGQ
jgi:hypothetical protein